MPLTVRLPAPMVSVNGKVVPLSARVIVLRVRRVDLEFLAYDLLAGQVVIVVHRLQVPGSAKRPGSAVRDRLAARPPAAATAAAGPTVAGGDRGGRRAGERGRGDGQAQRQGGARGQ